ncbi:MAG: hypothetical protein ACRD1G_17175, partial [Acidimicrobiales bacterium]
GMRIVAAALGMPAPPDAVIAMTVVRLPDPVASDATARHLREDIALRGVEVTIAGSRGAFYLRTSCHLYNDLADFKRLGSALHELLPPR